MKRILPAVLLVTTLVPVGAVHAWEEGPYLGFGLGASHFDIDREDYDDGNLVSGSVDRTDTGYKIFGGYRLMRNLGVELYYADLGEANFSGRAGSDEDFWCAGAVGAREDVDGFGVSILGNVPVGRDFNAFGKFGVFRHTFRSRFGPALTLDGADCVGEFRDRDTDTQLMLGVGFSYQVDYRTAVQFEWERYTDILDNFDVDLFTLGLTFYLY